MGTTALRMAFVLTVLAALPTAAVAQKPNTKPPVSLEVEVDDSEGMRITSDGLGSYADGVDGVAASIDQYGNLIIDFQTTRTVQRKLHYNYGDGVVAPPHNYFSTIRQDGDTTKMQELVEGGWQCVKGGPVYTLDDAKKTQYRHLFQREVTGIDVADTAFLLVTRTGGKEWTVESVNNCAGGSIVGETQLIDTPTVGKFKFTDRGRLNMPMRLTLTAK